MLGISGPEFLVILLVIVLVVGPQRLPEYTRKLTQLVRQLRLFVESTKEQIAEEVGPELADLNLKDLDPRQYDPRKIVRDALGEDLDAIRDELAHPFQSVAQAAKEVSDDAAAEVNAEVASARSKRSLSQMIQDKADATRQEREPAGQAAEQADGAGEPTAQAGLAEQAGAGGDSGEPAGQEAGLADQEPERTPEGEAEAPAEESEQAAQQSEQTEGTAGPTASVQQVEQAEAGEDSEDRTHQESAPAPDAGGSDESVGADRSDSDPARAAASVPSSLSTGPQPTDEDADAQAHSAPTLISPREIVRAANQAARTRREAATAVVDV